MSQVQSAVIRFHNTFAQKLCGGYRLGGGILAGAARPAVPWLYQWGVVHDRAAVVDVPGRGGGLCHPVAPLVPDECAIAAKRFGHSTGPVRIEEEESRTKHRFFGEVLAICLKWFGSMATMVGRREQILELDLAGPHVRRNRIGGLLRHRTGGRSPGDRGVKPLATRIPILGNGVPQTGGDVAAGAMGRPCAEAASVMVRDTESVPRCRR
ncbi:MAG: hypothetical protein AAF317_18225, partial [Pseudomonadota bacterium]